MLRGKLIDVCGGNFSIALGQMIANADEGKNIGEKLFRGLLLLTVYWILDICNMRS